ncbi:MAG: pyridoxal-phosphate dependent enzyme, partial [Prevotella sp.]|nr:pyridoxal-phosphate dependent enzyme [Prevotella sp.]
MAEKTLDSQDYLHKILLARIYDLVKVTPLQKMENLSDRLGVNVLIKREDRQLIHSFKIRGAYNKIKSLSDAQIKAGVVTASAGNHAQGVALSAKQLGIRAVIVMPTTTPDLKVNAVRHLGAEVVLYGDSFNASYDYAQQLAKKNGLTM